MIRKIRRWVATFVAAIVMLLTLGRVKVDRSGAMGTMQGDDSERAVPTRRMDE